jgi:hypothetical protein
VANNIPLWCALPPILRTSYDVTTLKVYALAEMSILSPFTSTAQVYEHILKEAAGDAAKERVAASAAATAGADANGGVRCAFFGRNLHSRMPLDPTPARLKLKRADV